MASDTPRVLITTQLPSGATLDEAIRHLGLTTNEVDTDYGLVDLHNGSYAMIVTQAAAEHIQGAPGIKGPFANPKIEPFGPVQRPDPE
ncbi:hypothetical protein [Streptomyces tubercidicus]